MEKENNQYPGTETEWHALVIVFILVAVFIIFSIGINCHNQKDSDMSKYELVERHETYNIVRKDSTYYIHTIRNGENRVEELPMTPIRK